MPLTVKPKSAKKAQAGVRTPGGTQETRRAARAPEATGGKGRRRSLPSEPVVFEVIIDGLPPSLNNLYATIEVKGRSRRILSSTASAWKRDACLLIRSAAQQQGWTIEKKVSFSVEVAYTAPDALRWDLDGKQKLLLDAFCMAFGVDDRYLMSLNQTKERAPARQLRMRVWVAT
jgi:Holliday junction resolvase RusA-like endonuclease